MWAVLSRTGGKIEAGLAHTMPRSSFASRPVPGLTATPFTRQVDRRILTFIRSRGLLPAGACVLVAVSGGPDSTALLLVLSRLREELGLGLTAGHFDHMLRSRAEADEDARFVRLLADSLGVPVVTGRGDVRARARRQGESVEDAARRLRFRFLVRAARKAGATVVAVGHTLDDRAETVLLHIVRGSGLDGLAAMPARAPWPFGKGPEIARPLLALRRADTERYCRESGVEPRRDPTNDLLVATRNRVRHEVMPVLRRLNPRVEEALTRLAEAAGRDLSFIESFLEPAWRLATGRDRGGITIDRRYLERLDVATTSRTLRRAAAEVSGGRVDLKWEDVERVLGSLNKRRAKTSLPGGLVAVTDPWVVTIWPGQPPRAAGIPQVPLAVPGKTRAGGWTIEAREENSPKKGPEPGPYEVMVDSGSMWAWWVRSRRPGDRLRPLGLGGTKKVQDILVDAKVPAEERDGLPIVVDERGIVWVVGHCIDERVKVTSGTRQVVHLRALREE